MALAYALKYIQSKNLARLTNYGEYLEKHPARHEAQIHEASSWSCVHGVGRWMTNCGCNSGSHPGWNQNWRTPLRNSLDWLRDQLAPLFEAKAGEFLRNPWQARDEYISIILDRSESNRDKFFTEQASRTLQEEEKVAVLKLLELQRHAMLMYTSCGWFFDEISGLESVQVVQYAARALQLGRELFGQDLEAGFLERFQEAKSNIAENGDGRRIYDRFVKPAMIDWDKAGAHYAISSLFRDYGDKTPIFSLSFEDEHRQLFSSGKTRLVVGRTRVISQITRESHVLTYAILYMGEHNLTGGVRHFDSMEEYDAMLRDVQTTYERADFPETIRQIDSHFGKASYSLQSLFKDELRRILNDILASTGEDLESRFRLIVERYEPLLKFLESAGAPLPEGLETVTDFVLRGDIRRQVQAEALDLDRLRSLFTQAQSRGGRVLDPSIGFAVGHRLELLIQKLAAHPEEEGGLEVLTKFAQLVMPLPLGLNLWKVQNTYWEMLQSLLPGFRNRAIGGDEKAQTWLEQFVSLGKILGFASKHLESAMPAQMAA
jgi:hypothetical protein